MISHPDEQHEPGWYEIRLQGRLDARWSTWFDGMTLTISPDSPDSPDSPGAGVITVLRGHVVDQAALHGLLARLRDVSVPLLSVARVNSEPADGDGFAADEDTR